MHGPLSTLVGIVGYSPVLDCYPLGPLLMAALEAELDAVPGVRVENMTWSPLHIVQRFQDAGAERPGRLILIGGASVSTEPGTVRAFRWKGGSLPPTVVQERVYEAVTGIVDIENTLMIGEHFQVWPAECFTVEVDLPPDVFGRMVIADNEGWADDDALTEHLGFSPARTTAAIATQAAALARSGQSAAVALSAKSAHTLAPVRPFIRNFTREPQATGAAGD